MADKDDLEAALAGDNDLVRRDLRQADFKGKDFIHRNFDEAYLQDADFSGADLTQSTFKRAKMAGLIGIAANFSNTEVSATSVARCNFENANFSGANLKASHFTATNFLGANLVGAQFQNSTINEGSIFSNALVDETTMFDGAMIFRPTAKQSAFRFYRVERGKLVRKSDAELQNIESANERQSFHRAREAIDKTILALATANESAPPIQQVSPSIGHNNPPESPPLDGGRTSELITVLKDLRAEVTKPEPSQSAVKSANTKLEMYNKKIGAWMAEEMDLFADEFAKTAGQEAAKAKTWIGLWLLVSGALAELVTILPKLFL